MRPAPTLSSFASHLGALLLLASLSVGQAPDVAPGESAIPGAFGRTSLLFVENRGQLPNDVAFVLHGSDKTLYFTPGGVTYVLMRKGQRWIVKLDFLDASPEARLDGEAPEEAVFSYFRGPEAGWTRGVPTYRRLRYRDLWPGIDLVYHAGIHHIKYEFVVHPGADPGQIQLVYRGAEEVCLDGDGTLRVKTPVGDLVDAAPVAWQEDDGRRSPVEVAYDPMTDGPGSGRGIGYRVGRHDPKRTLVIDPAVLVYCGYIGGVRADEITGIAVDTLGAVYVTGGTGSDEKSFPVAVGPDLTYGGEGDVFVAKVKADGRGLIYCGYIGGAYHQRPYGIAIDGSGNAYITGTGGFDYPRKVGPNPKQTQGAFVTKINAVGTDLVYSGFIGGTGITDGYGIAVDTGGCAYVTGKTNCDEKSFPVKVGPYLTHNGDYDAFVAKVNSQGTDLVYCGFVGGYNTDVAVSISVDPAGRAYLAGWTMTEDQSFPVKVGPDLTFNRRSTILFADGFVARVNALGTDLEYCGYIGGYYGGTCLGIVADAAGHAYVTGSTVSNEGSFPAKVGPDLTHNGVIDAFVAKVAATGKDLVYCGYIGGDRSEAGNAIALDANGAVYVAGYTGSSEKTFPVKVGPDVTYTTSLLGTQDAFVAKVAPSGKDLVYCGYIGGERNEDAEAIAVDRSGNAYVGGWTESSEKTFPVKVGPFLTFKGTGYFPTADAFVAKVALTLLEGGGTTQPGGRVDFTLTASESPALPYQAASSFGVGPIPIDQRALGLSYDGLLWISLSGLVPSIFENYRGTVGADGHGAAALYLPPIALTIGLKIHTAFVTLDSQAPSGIKSISNTWSFTITK